MSTSDVPRPPARRSLVDRLNEDCFCIEIDKVRLAKEIASRGGDGSTNEVAPNLFATVPVFVERSDYDAMVAVVTAVERAVGSESYRSRVLTWAPEIAGHDFGPIGVFTGYDFHLTPQGPRLIEINTNAGGAFLCTLAATSQTQCCPVVAPTIAHPSLSEFEAAVSWPCSSANGDASDRPNRCGRSPSSTTPLSSNRFMSSSSSPGRSSSATASKAGSSIRATSFTGKGN